MRVEVLGGVERRRRWSHDDKMRMIEETLAPGAVVTDIARRHGIATSLRSLGGGGHAWRLSLRRDRGLSRFSSPRLRPKAADRSKPQWRCHPGSAGA
jgi:transposase-like protein